VQQKMQRARTGYPDVLDAASHKKTPSKILAWAFAGFREIHQTAIIY